MFPLSLTGWWIKFDPWNDGEFIALRMTPLAKPHTVEHFTGRPQVKATGQVPVQKSGLYTFPECRLVYELDDYGLGTVIGDSLRYTAAVVPTEGGDRWVYKETGTYFLKLTKDGKQTASIPLMDLVKDYQREFRQNFVENQWALDRNWIAGDGNYTFATPPRGKLLGLIPINYREHYRISCETGHMEYTVFSDKETRVTWLAGGLVLLFVLFQAVRKLRLSRKAVSG